MRLVFHDKRHTLLVIGLRPTSGSDFRFVTVSLSVLLGSVFLSLVESLDECASVTVNVVALVLPEAHLLAGGAQSIYLLSHRWSL